MSINTQVRKSGSSRKVAVGVAFASVVAFGSAAALNANAAEAAPTPAEIQTSCVQQVPVLGKADRCSFTPTGRQTFLGARHKVTGNEYNCTTSDAPQKFTETDTTTSSNTLGVTVTVEAQLSPMFNASISATYSHTWEHSTTLTEERTLNLKPGEVGWIERATAMQRVSGKVQANFPSRRFGHFVWFAYPTVTGADKDSPSDVILKTRAMTPAERQNVCGANSVDPTLGGSAVAVVERTEVLEQANPDSSVGVVPASGPANGE